MDKKTKDVVFQVSALLILFAAVFYLFRPDIARFVMIAGVGGFAVTTFLNRYPGKSLRGKRLFNIQVFAILMMVAATVLMFMYTKEWVVLMFIAALFTLYSAILLPRVYEKEQKENENKK